MARPTDGEKRHQILESAFQVFGERGFRSTTIKSIAKSAGIAPGSIYTYFRDKEELFTSTVRETWERILEEFKTIVESPGRIETRLSGLLDVGFSKLKQSLPLLRGMLFEAAQSMQFQENLNALCGYVERLLAEGKRERVLNVTEDPGQWRKVVRLTVVGILFSAALAPEEATDREIAGLKAAITRMLSQRIVNGEGKKLE
jgi:AcrR family transcriptional regulator